MEFKCPACHSVIYSRKQKLCGQCGSEIPADLLLSPEQKRILDEDQKRSDKRNRLNPLDRMWEPGGNEL
jgi:rRNA maturation endonuclease Nob1